MPDALDLLKTRRSVKPMELSGPGPSRAEIDTLLTIAARVPDHGKLTPWRFIVFEGEARLAAGEKIAAVFAADHARGHARPDRVRAQAAGARAAGRSRWSAAPARTSKFRNGSSNCRPAPPAMNLVNAAHAMGYAASWITEWYAYDRRVLDALGLAANERMAGFVHIGRPAKPPEDRDRPKLADIVTRFPANAHDP